MSYVCEPTMAVRLRLNKWSALYSFGYVLASSGLNGFYRKIEITGLEHVPLDKPILFAPNHQNAFIDGAIVGYAIGKPTYFVGRSDIFKNKLANSFLNGLNCLPIYRERDGVDYREKNLKAFDTFYNLLAKGNRINIFPEGGHFKDKRIRGPLKKGVFRIAVGAENKYDRTLDVHVVPVGIDYERHSKMGGSLLINFGAPYKMLDYISDQEEEQEAIYDELVVDLEKRMHDLLIDIQNEEHYQLIRRMLIILDQEIDQVENSKGQTLTDRFQAEKGFVKMADKAILHHPALMKELNIAEQEFSEYCRNNQVKPWLFRQGLKNPFTRIITEAAMLPFVIPGIITSFLPFMIPHWLMTAKVEDEHFHASIKILLGSLMFMVFWVMEILVVAQYVSFEFWLLFSVSLPLTAWFSSRWWRSFRKTLGIFRYRKLRMKNQRDFVKARENYTTLVKGLSSIYQD